MPEFKNALWLRVSGICGFLAPLIAFAFIFSAIAFYSEFSWVDNALSDLGVVAGVTAVLFNSGLIISGVLCFVFATGLFMFLGERAVGKIGAFIFVLASLALFAIGVFPESIRPVHYFVSVMFFVLLPISMLVIVGTFWLMRQVRMAVFTLLVAVAAAAPWILLFSVQYVSGVAVPEAVSAFASSVWAVVLSGEMLRQASRSRTS
jgi:hypothetical membrane protein